MFIRVKTSKNSPRKSVQIVESVRDGNKVKQRTVRYVGIAMDDDELNKLKDVAEFIKAKIEQEESTQANLFAPEELAKIAIDHRKKRELDNESELNVNLKQLKEEQRSIVGVHEVYGKIYSDIGFNKILPNPARNKAATDNLHNIVMARIANPDSKRLSVINLERDFGVNLNLDMVYHMMDKINDEVITKIKAKSYESAKTLLGGKIDVLFYDATTLYFESFIEDELKQNGYSKDMKFNQPQILLALFVTESGLPIGYELFPGSTYEGHTLIAALINIKKYFKISRVVFVADSGLFNKDNLHLLEKEGYDYIVGSRLKNLNKTIQSEILKDSNYKNIDGNDDLKYHQIKIDDIKNLIISYSKKRAYKDKEDRDKSIKKLLQKLRKSKNPESLISNYGYKKYLNIKGNSAITINEEKIIKDAKWDGLHGITTNIKDINPVDILSHYKGLWQIEETFRITKHDLKVRPIFHFKPKRIKAHIAICFMALTCIRQLEYRVRLQYKKISPEIIRQELNRVQLTFLRHQQTKEQYCIPSKISLEAKKIYQTVGIKANEVAFKL